MAHFLRRIVDQGINAIVVSQATIAATVQMGLEPMVRGYVLAVRRLEYAVNGPRADDVYIALFEASNWLVSIAARTQLENDDEEAVRLARNRTHHQWASAVQQDASGAWTWRPLENLPTPEEAKYRGATLEPKYRTQLANKPVIEVFRRLQPQIEALAPGTDLT
jgi:hypothetical protein